jgi:hypothetical protein
MSEAKINEEGCGGCGKLCTKIVDFYGNETQSNFIGVSPS